MKLSRYIWVGIFAFFGGYASTVTAQNAPSLFMDEVMPSRGSVDMFSALKQGKLSALYVRPNGYNKKTNPTFQIKYVNDFATCNSFDDERTLYADSYGYKLDAGFFNTKAKIDLFMEEPLSANLVNGECLLATPADVPKTDYVVSYKSRDDYTYQIKTRAGVFTALDDEKFLTIFDKMGQAWQKQPRYKAIKNNVGKVSDANIVRALTIGNDTMKHTALYLLRNRMNITYERDIVIIEPTLSPNVLEALLKMDYLKSIDEVTRASVLTAIGTLTNEKNSAQVKQAVITALNTEYPLEVAKSSRDMGKRFGIVFPPDGKLLPGHRSHQILVGATITLVQMSEKDRNEILASYPESFQSYFVGLYKNLNATKALQKVIGESN